ncbi:hypothetical protein RI054_02g11110 [Pseudoscourfieldia marina]
MVSTRSGDAHQAETNATSAAAAAAAAAAARNDDDFVDADDNHQDSAQPEHAAADQGTRAAPPRRAASPRPAGRGNRGRSQRRGGSAPPSRNQSPQHQQPPRQNPTSNTRYDITNHERGEVRRMLIRNPPPSFEPTQAWFAAMYANLKLTGIEPLARVRFTGDNILSLASILHSTIQAACASSPEASLIVETAEDARAHAQRRKSDSFRLMPAPNQMRQIASLQSSSSTGNHSRNSQQPYGASKYDNGTDRRSDSIRTPSRTN